MISGSKTGLEARSARPRRRTRAWPALLLFCGLFVAGLQPALAFDLGELMGLLARQKNGQASFTEQRYVHGLEGPLYSSGLLSFEAPDRLLRQTQSPRPETMSVDGNSLTLSRGGRTRSLSLDSMPELLGLVEAMRGTLSGNASGLQRYFRSALSGDSQSWVLELEPIDDRLAAQVRALRLSGKDGQVLGIEMEFVGGDRSVTTISPMQAVAAPAPVTAPVPQPAKNAPARP